MDMSDFAAKALEWEKLQRAADALATELENEVLSIGKTQTIGNVRVTYSNGRKSFDYQAAANGHSMVSEATIGLFSKEIPATIEIDWKGICKHAGIEPVVASQTDPSAKIKLMK